jgi:hypothetical protein
MRFVQRKDISTLLRPADQPGRTHRHIEDLLANRIDVRLASRKQTSAAWPTGALLGHLESLDSVRGGKAT